MTKKIFFSLILLWANNSQAQDCSDLLKQGLREYTKTITQTENYSQTSSAICEAYQEYRSTNNSANANAKYKLIFKGNANYSKQQIEEIGKLYCEQNFALQTNGNYGEYQRSFIDPNYAKMYSECINASSKNVQLKIEPTDNQNQSVTLTASYLSPSGFRPKVTGINYDENLLEVNGGLKNAALSQSQLDGFLTLIARRKDLTNTTPFQVGTELVLAKSHQMTLNFENASITITFPAIYPQPARVEIVKGVGEIIASMLPKEKFLEVYGRDWALADGSATPISSAYKLVSDNLPDLRGVFLRGKNYDREITQGNPDGDLSLGTYSEDLFESHNHELNISTHTGNYNRAMLFRSEATPTLKSKSVDAGGSETRPKNVTVNYFIKIN